MEDYPEDMAGLIRRFRTEEDCLAYLESLRWPEGWRCTRCGCTEFWRKTRGRLLCRSCRSEETVTAGTLFDRSHKPLRLWFQAIWYVVGQKNGVSALGLQKALGLGSYQTAWAWLHKLRRAMVRPLRDGLSGIVEVDETWVGGVSHGQGSKDGKSLIFIAAERVGRKIGRIRLQVITDTTGASLLEAVISTVEQGSIVRTDGWEGYNVLSSAGYQHAPIPHKSTV